MAKGNLFLGMGRGKVGDVVFYRMNGWQMARVRNRNPKNPRTVEQLLQRAVIATTMKAYSLGKEIFDHSFQGYTVGEGCMRRFNSMNARILREQLIADYNEFPAPGQARGRFVAPRSTSATPIIGMMVSEGTLYQTMFNAIESNGTYNYQPINQSASIKTVNEWLQLGNFNAGDIFTFVFMLADLNTPVYVNPWDNRPYANQYNTRFAWVRLIIKSDISDEVSAAGTKINQIFDIETGGNVNVTINPEDTFFGKQIEFNVGLTNYAGTIACIRSRDDVDLRSTEYTVPFHSKDFGIESGYIQYVWENLIQKVGQSELILEGGEGKAAINETPDSEPIIDSPVDEAVLPRRGRTKA